VRNDSPYQKLSDLKGKRVAHTTPSSNSGNLAPRTLFPPEGLTPDLDYKVMFSGKHEHSVAGVASGDFDAAPIAHDVLLRMAERGLVKLEDFRIIWKSRNFPPGGLSMAHDLTPALQQKIRACTYGFRYTAEMIRGFQGADRWLPIDYKQDWEVIRRIAHASGQSFGRTAFERERKRANAEARK
jgi:phosphonate transport system substrate-binding protein